MGLNRFPLNDFSGGWNIRDDPSVLQPNESPLLNNCTLGPVGQLQQRPGTEIFLNGIGASSIDNILYVDNFFGDQYFWSDGQGVYSYRVSGAVRTTLVAARAYSPYAVFSFFQFPAAGGNDTVWVAAGVDWPWKVDVALGTVTQPRTGIMGLTTLSCLRAWKQRLCGVTGAAFVYSPPGDPEGASYGTLTLGQPGPGGMDLSEQLMAIEVLGENILAFKRDEVFVIYDPVSFANRSLGGPGVEGPFQTCVIDNRCYYFNRMGVYSVGASGDIRKESDQIRPVFTGETLPGGFVPPVDSINAGALSRVRVCATPNNRVFVSIPTGVSATPTVLYEVIPGVSSRRVAGRRYETTSAVFRHTWALGAPQAMHLTRRPGRAPELLCAFPGSRHFGKMNSNSLFDYGGVIPDSSWYSAYRGIQEEEPIERLRRLGALYSGRFEMRVMNVLDGRTLFTQYVPIVPPPSITYSRVRPETRSRYHQIAITGTDAVLGATGWSISSLELVYRGGKEH